MGHYPLYPENEHNLWDGQRMVDLFERSGNVLAYLCGHNHAGNLGRHGGTWFVNFKGMVDTPAENAFAIAEIFRPPGDHRLRPRGKPRARLFNMTSCLCTSLIFNA